MTFVTLGTEFRYSMTPFSLIAEAERLESSVSGDAHWMGKWKLRGRAGWYRACAKSQAHHEHRVFDWTNATAICSCGLVKDEVTSQEELLTSPGHIDVVTKLPETFYVICQEVDDDTDRMVCFCKMCDTVEEVPKDLLTEDGDVPLVLFMSLRGSHVCTQNGMGEG